MFSFVLPFIHFEFSCIVHTHTHTHTHLQVEKVAVMVAIENHGNVVSSAVERLELVVVVVAAAVADNATDVDHAAVKTVKD